MAPALIPKATVPREAGPGDAPSPLLPKAFSGVRPWVGVLYVYNI